MGDMIDTLKTTSAGVSGWWLSISGWLPEVVSLLVGIATLTYLIIKIYKELKQEYLEKYMPKPDADPHGGLEAYEDIIKDNRSVSNEMN